MNKKISIHQALAEVKAYDDRIRRAINTKFIAVNKKSNKKPYGMTVEELSNNMKGALDSATALIENKKRIKSAISLSNSSTMLSIGDRTYTVSEAIERKNLLSLEESLLQQVKIQYNDVTETAHSNNDNLNDKLESYLKSVLGDKDKRDVDSVKAFTKLFNDSSEYEIIDPNDLRKYINILEESIVSFKTEVDYKLSESNSTTFIEINLVD